MDEKILRKAIAELRKQKAHLDQAIDMLEVLASGKPRRGRPPKLLSEDARAQREGVKKAAAKMSRKKTNRVKRPIRG